MTTAETALKKMREFCLSLPDTTESAHFGDVAFKVGKKMFASCGAKQGPCELVFQVGNAKALLASDSRFKPYPRMANLVVLDAAQVKDWEEVRALALESYQLNAPARPRKK